MELALALLLAASVVALASAWSALRTERERARRLEERLASVRTDPAPPAADAPAMPPAAPREDVPTAAPPSPAPPAPHPEPDAAPTERLLATLVAPAERLAESIQASEGALAKAAEHLRTPLPPSPAAPLVEEAAAPEPGTESVERAVATAERISDERVRLADDVRSLRAALERVVALDGGLGRGLAELSRTAEALLPLASSVSGLADRANLLGLNVSLLAARAGEAGAPFEEAAAELRGLFEEARRLSRELTDAARRTDGGARRVASAVEESAGTVAAGQERGTRAAERLGALDGLCAQLERTLAEVARAARAAAEQGSELARRLETARSSLESRSGEATRLRTEAEATRATLRATAERIDALRLDGSALRSAVARATSGA